MLMLEIISGIHIVSRTGTVGCLTVLFLECCEK